MLKTVALPGNSRKTEWGAKPFLSRTMVRAAPFALLTLICGFASAQATVPELLEKKLDSRIRALDRALDGVLGVEAIDLTSGRVIGYHADSVFPTASSIKIPILIQMFRSAKAQEFRFTDHVTLTRADMVGGSGELQKSLARGPVTLTVRDLIAAMIEHSDNTATNKCIEMVKMERVNTLLDELGFPKTRLRRCMMDSAAAARGDENVSTPDEMARLLETIYRGQAMDRASSDDMLSILKHVKAEMRKAVPAGVEVASKPGDLPGVHCETGLILLPGRPFILSVFSTYLADDTANPVGDVTRLMCRYFSQLAQSNVYGRKLQ
ncbi:MAG: serine hydrolase [Bryobacteraceae bacterium]